jgi:hypothetical protein
MASLKLAVVRLDDDIAAALTKPLSDRLQIQVEPEELAIWAVVLMATFGKRARAPTI